MPAKKQEKDIQKMIGELVKTTREDLNLSQADLAKKLGTTQSAVARIEKGLQNLTTKQIVKLEEALGKSIISVERSLKYDNYIIEGGRKLKGSIDVNTSKNGALALMAGAIVNDGKTVLENIPDIEEIKRMIEIFKSVGISVKKIAPRSIEISNTRKISMGKIDKVASARIRSTLTTIGAICHRSKSFKLPFAGGCALGSRTTIAYRRGLEDMGVKFEVKGDHYKIESPYVGQNRKNFWKDRTITMYESSDTATITMILLASRIPATTVIRFAQQNYMVMDVVYFLRKLGVEIELSGSNMIIRGKEKLDKNIKHGNSQDPIEAMSFISVAVATGSDITVKGCPVSYMAREIEVMKEMGLSMGISKEYKASNGETDLVDIKVNMKKSKLRAPQTKVHATPYPGMNTDNLPFFIPIAMKAEGITQIHDWMYEDRLMHLYYAKLLGVNMELADRHRMYVWNSEKSLRPGKITCPKSLRPSVVMMIIMMGIKGKSKLREVYAIKRGYEDLPERLNKIGARITPCK